MLNWPLLSSPRSNEELFRARSASRRPSSAHPLDNARKTRFLEHIARRTYRSAAVHSNDSPVRRVRQRIAETLKQYSLSGSGCSSAARAQNIRCPHAFTASLVNRGPVPLAVRGGGPSACASRAGARRSAAHPGATGHAFCCVPPVPHSRAFRSPGRAVLAMRFPEARPAASRVRFPRGAPSVIAGTRTVTETVNDPLS